MSGARNHAFKRGKIIGHAEVGTLPIDIIQHVRTKIIFYPYVHFFCFPTKTVCVYGQRVVKNWGEALAGKVVGVDSHLVWAIVDPACLLNVLFFTLRAVVVMSQRLRAK